VNSNELVGVLDMSTYQMKMGNILDFSYFINKSPKKGFLYILFEKILTSKKWKANGLYIIHMARITSRKNSS